MLCYLSVTSLGVKSSCVKSQLLFFKFYSTKCKMDVSKFRGCLLGALIGDCLGEPFENEERVSHRVLHKYLEDVQNPQLRTPYRPFTDDTVMTHSIAESFIAKKQFDAKDLAQRFVKDYFTEPKSRGYGSNVVDVFEALRRTKCADPYGPATKQFNGSGSWGNGAAMRVHPVALFCHNNEEEMLKVARDTSRITHTHRLGINGALLQCLAIKMCLNHKAGEPFDALKFLSELTKKMNDIESDGEKNYCKQLALIEDLIKHEPEDNFEDEVVAALGNNVAALYSVPTAVYCFLRSQTPIPHIQTDSPFRRTIHLSISLNGDTDTIASMAGAICGALLGEDGVDRGLGTHCEGLAKTLRLADQLYALVV